MKLPRSHEYAIETEWTGNLGSGTREYAGYSRDHIISGAGKQVPLPGSSDPAFRGDASRYSPEELLVASLSTCHMLWVLHLCSSAGIVVTAYTDRATGVMTEEADGSGRFELVTLHPRMVITDASRIGDAEAIHLRARRLCFIANSVNFPVNHRPVVVAAEPVTPAPGSTAPSPGLKP